MMETVNEDRRSWVRWVMVGGLVTLSVVMLAQSILGNDKNARLARPTRVKIKSVLSGDKVKLKHHGRLIYAGIRAPFDGEPLFEQARRRNAELVLNKEIRLRYDHAARDRNGRLIAYPFHDDAFISDILVREGLAYVRLTTATRLFADRLLDAQREAREGHRGVWQHISESTEESYAADPKYGNFHRPSCGEVRKIKAQRLVRFESKDAALDAGYAPCNKCRP